MFILLFTLIFIVFLLLKQPVWFLEEAPIFNRRKPNRIKRFFNNFFMVTRQRMTEEELKYIHYLKTQKLNSQEIAEIVNRPSSVVRYWWKKNIDDLKKIMLKGSMIDEFKEVVLNFVQQGYTSVQIHRLLKFDYDFAGSIDTVRRCVNKIKKTIPKPPKKAYLVELPEPGKTVQIDFVDFGTMKDPQGKEVKIKVMIFVLPYSKHAYYHHVYTESGEDIFPALAEAFNFFGGVPQRIVCDNFKAIVVSNNNRGSIVLTEEALHFERFFNTKFNPCHTYSPWEKGGVENAAKYIQHNLITQVYSNHDEAQEAINLWNKEVASVRTHGTTKKQPINEFRLKEQPTLLPLPQEKYIFAKYHTRRVHDKTYLVSFEGNKYSVEPQYVGEDVNVHEENNMIVITYGATTIGRHEKVAWNKKGVIRIDPKHHDAAIHNRSVDKDMNLMASFIDLSIEAEKIYDMLKEEERKHYMKEILNISDSLGKDFVATVLKNALLQQDISLKNIELLVNQKKLEDNKKLKKSNKRKYMKNNKLHIELAPINRDDYDI